MYQKELSLRQKPGWEEYSKRSWVLIPKINGRTLDSLITYGLAGFVSYTIYNNGGLAASFQMLRQAYFK